MKLLWLLAMVTLALPAYAAAPPEADPAMSEWFADLYQNNTSTYPSMAHGYSCCGVDRDCRFVQWEWREAPADEPPGKFGHGHFWALIKVGPDSMENFSTAPGGIGRLVTPGWTQVPDSVVLKRHDNPTGRAVACLTGQGAGSAPPHIIWYCFVKGPEA